LTSSYSIAFEIWMIGKIKIYTDITYHSVNLDQEGWKRQNWHNAIQLEGRFRVWTGNLRAIAAKKWPLYHEKRIGWVCQ
jgi:hypothetical protein